VKAAQTVRANNGSGDLHCKDTHSYHCTHRSAGRAGHHGVADVVCAVGVLAQLASWSSVGVMNLPIAPVS
jgi:hypothetical protein